MQGVTSFPAEVSIVLTIFFCKQSLVWYIFSCAKWRFSLVIHLSYDEKPTIDFCFTRARVLFFLEVDAYFFVCSGLLFLGVILKVRGCVIAADDGLVYNTLFKS